MKGNFTSTQHIANLNKAIPVSPTADSPYGILDNLDDYKVKGYRFTSKAAAATGATPIALFTVTGDVVLAVIGVVKTTLTTSDAIAASVGVAGNTAVVIANVADATGLAQHEIWHDATPDANIELSSVWNEFVVSNGQDIILTTTGTVTAGSITFYVRWFPLSSDGNVVAA